MSNTTSIYTLTPASALCGYRKDFSGIIVEEITDLSIVSIAVPLGNDENFENTLHGTLGIERPKVGMSSSINSEILSNGRLLGLSVDQMFLLFTAQQNIHPIDWVNQKFNQQSKPCAYLSDQSDSWAVLRITSKADMMRGYEALSRICMLDLHEENFPIGAVTRTVMEYLGVIILRESSDNQFLLLSARSSANSFKHAVETSFIEVSEGLEASLGDDDGRRG